MISLVRTEPGKKQTFLVTVKPPLMFDGNAETCVQSVILPISR